MSVIQRNSSQENLGIVFRELLRQGSHEKLLIAKRGNDVRWQDGALGKHANLVGRLDEIEIATDQAGRAGRRGPKRFHGNG